MCPPGAAASSVTSTSSCAPHPAPGRYVVRAAGSVASSARAARWHVRRGRASRITGSGQRRPRASTSTAVTAGRPEPRPHGGHGVGQHAQNRSTSAPAGDDPLERQGHPHVAVGEHPHRGEDVARLERAGGAGRPRGHREAPPVELVDQRLAVDVQAGERHHVRQPVPSGRRRPRCRGSRQLPPGSGRPAHGPRASCSAPVVGLLPGLRGGEHQGDHRLGVGAPPLGFCRGPGRRHRVRAGTTSTPTGGAAPRPRVADEHVVGRGHRVAAQATQASTSSGTPCRGAPLLASSSGWRVPTSPLAVCSAAATSRPRQGALERVEVDPAQGVHPHHLAATSPEAAASWRRVRTAECSTAEATTRAPLRRPACSSPSHPARSPRAGGEEGQLGREHPQPRRDDLAGPVQQRPRLPALGVQPRGSAQPGSARPEGVARGGAGGCWRRRAGPGRGRGWRDRGGGHTPTVARP